MKSLVLLSGPIAVGKSSVARELASAHRYLVLRTSPFLVGLAKDLGRNTDRVGLQDLGDTLDRDTDFRWVIDSVAVPAFEAAKNVDNWLLDSVRKKRQVDHFRAQFGSQVVHVHLTAAEALLEARYESRRAQETDPYLLPSYADAIAHPNEASARELIAVADLIIDVSLVSSASAATTISARSKAGACDA